MSAIGKKLAALRAEQESFPARRWEVVEEARAAGMTWLEIATDLGMTQHGLIKSHRRDDPWKIRY